jgi:hypothetical protein
MHKRGAAPALPAQGLGRYWLAHVPVDLDRLIDELSVRKNKDVGQGGDQTKGKANDDELTRIQHGEVLRELDKATPRLPHESAHFPKKL